MIVQFKSNKENQITQYFLPLIRGGYRSCERRNFTTSNCL